MPSCTDTFNLNQSPLFSVIRDALPADRSKTQNLVESKDDVLFVWNSRDACVLALNWRMAKVKGFEAVKYQQLLPSRPQNFQIDRILCSPEGEFIALAGPRGLSVVELPRRWGPNGQFLDGKEQIICRSHNLDEQFFVNNSPLELLQIRWHPASPTGSHILALVSDNTIRVYDEFTLKHVWRVGPILNSLRPTSSSKSVQVPMLNSLGETAVDFDIAPARLVSSSSGSDDVKDSRIINSSYITGSENATLNNKLNNKKSSPSTGQDKVEWPIVILRGNGNIYVLCAGIDTVKPHLQGPLTMIPQANDNYGLDSCSILVIPSMPPALVIAESTGKLHNALLVEAESTEESFHEIDSSLVIYPSEWTVNVLETVELELGLPDCNKAKSHSCPIYLKRDFVNESRYFAYHNTGLHVIAMNFIKQLQQYVDSEDAIDLSPLNTPSHAEYLICTKALESGKVNAVLGFTLFQMPSGIMTLLSSGQVISLNLITDPSLLPSWDSTIEKSQSDKHTSDLPIQKIMSESFVTYIRNILKGSITQPILSLDKSAEPSPQESYALLMQAISVLKEQHFDRHEKARIEILKRVNILKRLKEQQRKEVELLELDKEKIREDAERLAEKYEDMCDKQQIITRRCQELVSKANLFLPNNTMADKDFVMNVEKINEATKKMKQAIEQAQKKISSQRLYINKFMETGEMKKIDLPPKQEKTIKEILTQITLEIESQIKEIKKINNIINL